MLTVADLKLTPANTSLSVQIAEQSVSPGHPGLSALNFTDYIMTCSKPAQHQSVLSGAVTNESKF